MTADSGTYDQATILRRQKIAEAMLGDALKPKKIEHWAQGLAQLGQAGIGGYMANQANEEAKASKAADTAALASLLGGSPAAAPTASPVAAPVSPTQPGAVIADAMTDKSLPRGFRNQNPGNIEDGPFARSQPGYAGSDGRFAKFASMDQGTGAMGSLLDSYGKKGINTVGGIINRWAPASDGNNVSAYAQAVARAAGVDPTATIDLSNPDMKQKIVAAMAQHENGRPLPPVAQAMTPPQMPQSAPSGGLLAAATPQQRQMIAAGMNASEGSPARAIAMSMISNMTKAEGPTNDIREFEYGVKNPAFARRQEALKAAGRTQVTTNVGKDEEAFDKEAGKIVAGRFNDLAAEGPQAKQMISDVQTLQQLGTQIGTGKAAQAKATLGPYAEALGVKIDGLSDIQAYEAIVNRLAPNLRVKGSGAQSDLELKNFLKSLPSLGNTPGGNELISKTMEGLAANKAKAAEIGSMALNKEITRKEAEKQLRELPDPMQGWRDAQKAAKPAAAPEAAVPDRAAIEAEMKRRGLLK